MLPYLKTDYLESITRQSQELKVPTFLSSELASKKETAAKRSREAAAERERFEQRASEIGICAALRESAENVDSAVAEAAAVLDEI